MADNSEILFSQSPLFSWTSHCSGIYDCVRKKKKVVLPRMTDEHLFRKCQ